MTFFGELEAFNLNPGAFKALFIYSFLLKKKSVEKKIFWLFIQDKRVGDGKASHNHLIVFV